jgi:galactokinase
VKRAFRAPGRVNLIGEHTDYNLGFVLPAAIDLACTVESDLTPDGKLRIYSERRDESFECDLADIEHAEPQKRWHDYTIGVGRELKRAGYDFPGLSLRIRSSVPEGGGLSSSAALEVSSALALLRGQKIQPLELARLCQKAEVEFVGLPCGIMDQYTSIFGEEGSALKIDCRSLTHQTAPLPPGLEIVVVNTMVKHALGESAYRDRTRECAAAVEAIRKKFRSVESLRDVTEEQLPGVMNLMPPVEARRVRHVVTENARVEAFLEAARLGDLVALRNLCLASHQSLRDDYEVSCGELDYLVEQALEIDGVIAARMTGGGFGGCTVNLVAADAVESFQTTIAQRYQEMLGVEPAVYVCKPSAGAREIDP